MYESEVLSLGGRVKKTVISLFILIPDIPNKNYYVAYSLLHIMHNTNIPKKIMKHDKNVQNAISLNRFS